MTDLVPYQDKVLSSYDDVEKAARAMAGSGFFQDTRQASQAIVKILAAREIGLGPFAGMTGINIIQGRPAFGANLMAACVKKSGRYNYRVTEMTDKACTIEFLERLDGRWASCGVSTFTLEDAKKAGTKNLDKFPRNMLFARAMSNGVRWYCPDVMNGSVVYTPEELGAETDQDGNVISVESVEVVEAEVIQEETHDEGVTPAITALTLEDAMKVTNSEGIQYGELSQDKLSKMSIGIAKGLKNGINDEQRAEYLKKQQAIKLILQARADGEIEYIAK